MIDPAQKLMALGVPAALARELVEQFDQSGNRAPLLAVKNLSDLKDVLEARNNLGLGTAATKAAEEFATSAQGAMAETAVQPEQLDDALEDYAPLESPAFTGTVTGITKSMVGLGNVDNTSDIGKPVSTAQAEAIQEVRDDLAADTGAGLVGFKQTGTGAVERTLADKARERLTVRDFGAIGDGARHTVAEWLVGGSLARGYTNLDGIKAHYPHVESLDDSIDWAAFQSLANKVCQEGGAFIISAGKFWIDKAVVFNVAQAPGDVRDPRRVSIVGDGRGASVIDWRGGSEVTGGAFEVIGAASSGDIDFTATGFKIVGYSSAADGILLSDVSWAALDLVGIHGMRYGINGQDLISTSLSRCKLIGCVRNVNLERDNSFLPNAIKLDQCTLGSAKEWAVFADRPITLNINGGSCEGNGTDAALFPTERGGVKVVNSGWAGRVGLNVDGVYFEGNRGAADIVIECGAEAVVHNVFRSTFNRVSTTNYVKNNIVVRHTNAHGPVTLNLGGNGFLSANGYVANSGEKYWEFEGNGLDRKVSDLGSFYQEPAATSGGDFVDFRTIPRAASQDGGISLGSIDGGWRWRFATKATSEGSPVLSLEAPADSNGNTQPVLTSEVSGAGATMRLFAGGQEHVRIKSNGDVGLGKAGELGIKLDVDGLIRPKVYTLADLPEANSSNIGSLAFVSDATGGSIPVFSNGVNWLRVTDRTVVD